MGIWVTAERCFCVRSIFCRNDFIFWLKQREYLISGISYHLHRGEGKNWIEKENSNRKEFYEFADFIHISDVKDQSTKLIKYPVYQNLDTNEYPNIFGSRKLIRTNIQKYFFIGNFTNFYQIASISIMISIWLQSK